jgi:hypothetical protein
MALARASRNDRSAWHRTADVISAFSTVGWHLGTRPTAFAQPSVLGYSDSRRNGWAAWIGDALALLYAEQQGFAYHAHIEPHLMKAQRAQPHPDFIVARTQETRLLEGKGSLRDVAPFWSGEVTPGYKQQVDKWLGQPIALATGKVVCDQGMTLGISMPIGNPAQLLQIHTDPGHFDKRRDPPSNVAPVIQSHYARSLSLVGLQREAEALARLQRVPEQATYAVFETAGEKYVAPHQEPDWLTAFRQGFDPEGDERITTGIELRVFRALIRRLRESPAQLLQDFPSWEISSQMSRDGVSRQPFDDLGETPIARFPDGVVAAPARAARSQQSIVL